MVGLVFGPHDAAIARDDENHTAHHPPPRRQAKEVEQQVGEPCARDAAASDTLPPQVGRQAERGSATTKPRTTDRAGLTERSWNWKTGGRVVST